MGMSIVQVLVYLVDKICVIVKPLALINIIYTIGFKKSR